MVGLKIAYVHNDVELPKNSWLHHSQQLIPLIYFRSEDRPLNIAISYVFC